MRRWEHLRRRERAVLRGVRLSQRAHLRERTLSSRADVRRGEPSVRQRHDLQQWAYLRERDVPGLERPGWRHLHRRVHERVV